MLGKSSKIVTLFITMYIELHIDIFCSFMQQNGQNQPETKGLQSAAFICST